MRLSHDFLLSVQGWQQICKIGHVLYNKAWPIPWQDIWRDACLRSIYPDCCLQPRTITTLNVGDQIVPYMDSLQQVYLTCLLDHRVSGVLRVFATAIKWPMPLIFSNTQMQ